MLVAAHNYTLQPVWPLENDHKSGVEGFWQINLSEPGQLEVTSESAKKSREGDFCQINLTIPGQLEVDPCELKDRPSLTRAAGLTLSLTLSSVYTIDYCCNGGNIFVNIAPSKS